MMLTPGADRRKVMMRIMKRDFPEGLLLEKLG
jgi:hypothetical protein